MTITLGFWIIPFIITIAAIVYWFIVLKEDSDGYMFGLGAMLLLPVIGCGVLFVWLVYFAMMYFLK